MSLDLPSEAGPAPNLGWPQRLDRALQERSNVWKTHLRAVEYTTWFWLQQHNDLMMMKMMTKKVMKKTMLLMNVDDDEEDGNEDSSIAMLMLIKLWIQIIHTLESPLQLPRSQLWYELVIKKTTPEEWKHFSVLDWQKQPNNHSTPLWNSKLTRLVNLFFRFFCLFVCCLHPMWLRTFDSMDCLRCCGDLLVS